MQILVIDPDFGFFRSVKNTLQLLGDANLSVINARDLESAIQAVVDHANPKLAEKAPSKSKSDSVEPKDPSLLDKGKIEILATRGTQELVQVLSHDAPTFLGLEIEKLTALKLLWKSLVDIQNRTKFNQFLGGIKNADAVRDVFRFRDIHQRPFKAAVSVSLPDFKANLLKISIQVELDSSHQDDAVAPVKSADPKFIDMVIVNWRLISHQPKTLFEQLKKKVQQFNGAGERACVFMFSAHDQPDVDVRMILAMNCDVIFKPLDDLLFLQKFIVSLPEAHQGQELSFLYMAEQSFDVELAGEYSLAAVSEGGFQVRSRQPLRLGQRVKIYSDAFMSSAPNGLLAKGFHCREAEGWKYSSFAGFGLNQEQVRMLRQLVGKKADQAVDLDKKAESRKSAPVIHGMEEAPENRQKKQILLIDLDRESSKTLKEVVEHQFPEFEVLVMDSLKHSIYTMAPELTEAGRAEMKQVGAQKHKNWDMRPAFFPNQPLKIRYSLEIKFTGMPEVDVKKSVLLGVPAGDIVGTEDFWGEHLLPADRLSYFDFIRFISTGQTAARKFRFFNKSGQSHLIEVSGQLRVDANGPSIEITLQDRTELVRNDEIETGAAQVSHEKLRRIELVMLDAGFVTDLPEESLALVRQAVQKVTGRSNQPIVLLGPELKMDKLALVSQFSVDDYVCKPFDRGHLVRRLRAYFADPKKDLDLLEKSEGFITREGWIDFARPLKADGVGEYGLKFTFAAQLPLGSWGHFYHPDLVDSKGRGVLARCYKVEAFEADGNKLYRCHFMFIGVREERMQQIRLFLKRFAIQAEAAKNAS